MRNPPIVIIFCFCLFCNSAVLAQSYSGGMFTFCRQTTETLELAELKKCPALISKNKKLEVQSYTIAIFCPVTEDIQDSLKDIFTDITGIYLEYEIKGSELTQEVFDYLDKHHNMHLQITIDDIVAIDKGKEGRYEGFVFYLH
ncbi:MAG: hypothetical protein WAQ28_11845 [Bacteroidia bacterium]